MNDKIRLPRILVTNDDGFDAPGLELLTEIAADISDEVWVIAPENDQSGTSMQVTLHQPLRVTTHSARRFAVRGTPADCVAVALNHFMKECPPQLILSGINAGYNCGDDTNLSGTVGAALAGLMLGVPSVAVSQACPNRKEVRWETARAHLPTVLQILLQQGWRKETCVSVNLPDAPPDQIQDMVWTRSSQKNISAFRIDARTDLRDGDYFWLALNRSAGELDNASDIAALKRNQIAVSCLGLDRSINPGRAAVPLYPESVLHVGT